MKSIRPGQDVDPEVDSNPLSLVIQAEMVLHTIRVPKEKCSGMSDPADHVAAFESHMDLYSATDATKCWAFSATFRGMA